MSTCPKCRAPIKSSGVDAEYFVCGTSEELWSDKIDQSESCKRMAKLEAELSKRDKALEQAPLYFRRQLDLYVRGSTTEEAAAGAAEAAPTYAEWRKSRGDL